MNIYCHFKVFFDLKKVVQNTNIIKTDITFASLFLAMHSVSMKGCSPSTKLLSMMVLTTSYMVVELVVGNITNSMALVADSFHMFSDVVALVIALISVRCVIISSFFKINVDLQIELTKV